MNRYACPDCGREIGAYGEADILARHKTPEGKWCRGSGRSALEFARAPSGAMRDCMPG